MGMTHLTRGDRFIFAADIWVGRLPVKSSFELSRLIDKMIRYENDQTADNWLASHFSGR
jgi:hypothetical protein